MQKCVFIFIFCMTIVSSTITEDSINSDYDEMKSYRKEEKSRASIGSTNIMRTDSKGSKL